MLLDLNDASSIVEWWCIYPERHGALLSDWARRRPEHRSTILQARRHIQADPRLRAALERAADTKASSMLLPPLSQDEVAAGEVHASE